MAISTAPTPIILGEEIDRAESYLVCGMFDEATSSASSILRQLLQGQDENELSDEEREDMVESAGMVLVQSLNLSGRAQEIVKELELLFGSASAVSVRVFVTGECVVIIKICFKMSESPSTTVQGYLEEFLNNWRYIDGRYFPLSVSESNKDGSCIRFSIDVDTYMEVVELYVITLLAMSVKDIDLAISWVEKAMLPMEKRQELLRRLHSMNSSKVTSSSQTSVPSQVQDEYVGKPYNRHQTESGSVTDKAHTTKEEILKLSRQRVSCISWFPSINLKFGNTRLVVPSSRLLLASFLLLMYYLTRKKRAALKRAIAEKARSMKNAVLDLWQLAFSYQVNPLAAVQPLPTTTHGSRL